MSSTIPAASGPQDGDEQRPILPVVIQTKEEATLQHVTAILNVVHMMRGALAGSSAEEGGLSAEPRIAAELTFMKACERLDSILDDSARWGVSNHSKLNEAIASVHKTQERVLKAQLNHLEQASRPSNRLRPTIATYGLGHFLAIWGSLDKPGMAIIGRGKTPAEALTDFDAAFHRTPNEQITAIDDMLVPPPTDNDSAPRI